MPAARTDRSPGHHRPDLDRRAVGEPGVAGDELVVGDHEDRLGVERRARRGAPSRSWARAPRARAAGCAARPSRDVQATGALRARRHRFGRTVRISTASPGRSSKRSTISGSDRHAPQHPDRRSRRGRRRASRASPRRGRAGDRCVTSRAMTLRHHGVLRSAGSRRRCGACGPCGVRGGRRSRRRAARTRCPRPTRHPGRIRARLSAPPWISRSFASMSARVTGLVGASLAHPGLLPCTPSLRASSTRSRHRAATRRTRSGTAPTTSRR